MNYLYILKSEFNGALYIGSTNNLRKRLQDHNDGKVSSTSDYTPYTLVYYEAYQDLPTARKREYSLKKRGNARYQLLRRLGMHYH